jgi:hypothetical protein
MKKTHTTTAMTTEDVKIIREVLHTLKYPPRTINDAKRQVAQLRSYRANLISYNLVNTFPQYVSDEITRLCVIISNKMTRLNHWIDSQKKEK